MSTASASPETRRTPGIAKHSLRLFFPPILRWRSFPLLHHPAVAVRVAEREERGEVAALRIGPRHLLARLEMEVVANSHPALDELVARCLDVRNDELQALEGTGRVGFHHERDRAGGATWRQLHDAK